jgi:hypothetical protein
MGWGYGSTQIVPGELPGLWGKYDQIRACGAVAPRATGHGPLATGSRSADAGHRGCLVPGLSGPAQWHCANKRPDTRCPIPAQAQGLPTAKAQLGTQALRPKDHKQGKGNVDCRRIPNAACQIPPAILVWLMRHHCADAGTQGTQGRGRDESKYEVRKKKAMPPPSLPIVGGSLSHPSSRIPTT